MENEGKTVTVRAGPVRLAGATGYPTVRRWLAMLAAVVGVFAASWGLPGAAEALGNTVPSSVPVTAGAPLTLTQWKQRYEPAIGEIADDVLVVVDTGRKDAKHPTKKKVQAAVSRCTKWRTDAERIPGNVPPIPLAPAEKTWKSLIAASLSGSADCVTALTRGSTSANRDFHKQLARVLAAESQLARQLGTSAG